LKDKDEEDVKPVNTTIAGGGFYGNKPAEPTRQQQALPSRAAPTSSASHANIYPIEGLSPYAHKVGAANDQLLTLLIRWAVDN